jgi:hypothetical protein
MSGGQPGQQQSAPKLGGVLMDDPTYNPGPGKFGHMAGTPKLGGVLMDDPTYNPGPGKFGHMAGMSTAGMWGGGTPPGMGGHPGDAMSRIDAKFNNVGQDGGITDANGNVTSSGPPTPPPTPTPPGQTGYNYFTGADGIQNFTSPTVGSGPVNIQQPGGFVWPSFQHGYGSMQAPYANLGAQIQDAFRNNSTGGGRGSGNRWARYNHQGGTPQWINDSNPVGQPIPGNTYNPQAPMQAPPPPGMGGNNPPPAAQPAAPAQAAGPNHMQNFQNLLQQDPTGRLAMGYSQYGGARDWTQKNQGALDAMLKSQGGFGGVRNKYGAGNRFLDGSEEQSLMRMAGLGV